MHNKAIPSLITPMWVSTGSACTSHTLELVNIASYQTHMYTQTIPHKNTGAKEICVVGMLHSLLLATLITQECTNSGSRADP